ncbi:aliphatic sulfonates family ABC transporter, periplasmic ligand-binding protein [Ancylobacter novellus DSM 506]|uniref:Putative aliphatic sulfonates-binding protein n=1 Tax=Ancylobacter novellus (strain ATCC 8093 / DSM 506 / JCM 20403 / CCM 1077 / IAM 12100 / NBRC 12443 / NCIMB 10456) TaxID=639283 RepID=D7A635_ANCN5|nr:aliphatic sulfonate ABC transporter substrate-binding protein [Ancylobacter novellus]ADH88185.1 aliphatic sulfonates family ABC transporter, periplasmic ligand-binding protein [Ancylobacter novellus DSM 506]
MTVSLTRRAFTALATIAAATSVAGVSCLAASPAEIRVDWATYSPVSIVLKDKKFLEEEFAKDGTTIRWVQSAGSNKALEFLSAGSLDFGSTAGAAALIGRINGNPIKAVYVYSRPEWTALVTRKDSGITQVSDLKGKSVAVTRGTDPHIFLIRALAANGLTDKDVRFILLQHADGRLALTRGDVDAWAGLDPLMASAELDDGAVLFFRDPAANSWGVLNVREAFARENPETVKRVLAAYEKARKWAVDNPKELAVLLEGATKLPAPVIARQLSRTELTYGPIGDAQKQTIIASGRALQEAGVVAANVDVPATADVLIDSRHLPPGP